MPGTLISTVVSIVVREGLTEENIEKAAQFIIASGRKLSSKALAYLEERKKRSAASQEAAQNSEIPEEVREELQSSVRELLENAASPVYMGGIAFFCERRMEEDVRTALAEILTNINEDTEPYEWEDEADAACQQVVDDFMWKNYGRSLDESEDDYCISEDCLYLNLALDDDEEYYRLCDDAAIRSLADALNHLLRDRYITKFTTY